MQYGRLRIVTAKECWSLIRGDLAMETLENRICSLAHALPQKLGWTTPFPDGAGVCKGGDGDLLSFARPSLPVKPRKDPKM